LIIYTQWIYYASAFANKLSLVLFIYKPYVRSFFLFYFQLKFISSINSSDIATFTTTAVAVCPSSVAYKRFNTNFSVR
jgi:flagellar biosynthesis GTPase FlhF